MQIPDPFSVEQQSNIFESILEQCSMKMIDAEESNNEEPQLLPYTPECGNKEREQMWIQLDEPPLENILEEEVDMPEDIDLQLNKVKSLREQQQTKIALFLTDDKYKSLRKGQVKHKNESPTGKFSKSLSPKKTKRIDKPKFFRLVNQSD